MPKRIHRRHDADPREGLKKYGKATFADPVNNKYPIDTPGRIKAAWAYIHQPNNAEKYTDEGARTIKNLEVSGAYRDRTGDPLLAKPPKGFPAC